MPKTGNVNNLRRSREGIVIVAKPRRDTEIPKPEWAARMFIERDMRQLNDQELAAKLLVAGLLFPTIFSAEELRLAVTAAFRQWFLPNDIQATAKELITHRLITWNQGIDFYGYTPLGTTVAQLIRDSESGRMRQYLVPPRKIVVSAEEQARIFAQLQTKGGVGGDVR